MKPVTQGQVVASLNSLNTNKATGCDGIPAKVMKMGVEELSQPNGEWRLTKDNELAVSILSIDMSKAFDSLHPPLLLSKLKAYGFPESAV